MNAGDLAQLASERALFADWASARGWSVEMTDGGFLRLECNGSVILGPGLGEASREALREVARRLVRAERFAEQHQRP